MKISFPSVTSQCLFYNWNGVTTKYDCTIYQVTRWFSMWTLSELRMHIYIINTVTSLSVLLSNIFRSCTDYFLYSYSYTMHICELNV